MTRLLPRGIIAALSTLLFFATMTFNAPHAGAAEDSGLVLGIDLQHPFHPSDNVMGGVDQALEKAVAEEKQLLVIIGANWCHDTRGLLNRFAEPSLQNILEDHYIVHLVDAGPLSGGIDVAKRFGLPIYYATPTVLIIDPVTQRLMNEADMHQWRDADSLSFDHTQAYFAAYQTGGNTQVAGPQDNPKLAELDAMIEEFFVAQSARVERGYGIVGPMAAMAADQRPDNFVDLWMELRDLRYRLPDDISAMKADVRTRLANGETGVQPQFPEYPAFSWE